MLAARVAGEQAYFIPNVLSVVRLHCISVAGALEEPPVEMLGCSEIGGICFHGTVFPRDSVSTGILGKKSRASQQMVDLYRCK